MKKRKLRLPQVLRRPPRVAALIIVRESSEKEKVQFDGMREQTYQMYRAKPQVEAIRKAGLTPWESDGGFVVMTTGPLGNQIPEEVLVETRTHGKTKAILFGYRDYWHLWSMASAARESAAGVNEFTEILVTVIKKLRPRELLAANISRLVRSQHQATRLQFVMRGRVDKIIAGGTAYDLAGEGSSVGAVLFQTLAMVAAMERDLIVQRTTAGLVSRWRRGLWPYGKGAAPYGYVYDQKTGRLEPDEAMRPVISQMLRILASQAPPSEQQLQLADLGLMTRKRRGRQESVDVIRDPEVLLRTINAWASVYLSAEYLVRWKNPFHHAAEIAGVAVTRYPADTPVFALTDDDDDLLEDAYDLDEDDLGELEGLVAEASPEAEDDILPISHLDVAGSATGPSGEMSNDPGELQMLVKLDVPEDGWADSATLAAYAAFLEARGRAALEAGVHPNRPLSDAITRESVNPGLYEWVFSSSRLVGQDWTSQTGLSPAHARRELTPFAGRAWSDDTHQFTLAPTTNSSYMVWRWSAGKARRSYSRHVRLLSKSQRQRRAGLLATTSHTSTAPDAPYDLEPSTTAARPGQRRSSGGPA